MTFSLYVLVGYDIPDETRQRDFEVRKGRSKGIVALVSGSEALYLLLCPTLLIHVHNLMTEKKTLEEVLSLEECSIPAYSIFIRDGYMQHGACGRWAFPSLHCLLYLNPSSYGL